MGAAPRVSAVLVAYNRSRELPATLDGILAQGFGDFELIVSDDCSTDATADVCAEYARRDSRVRYRRNPTNLRMPGNLNAALSEARGDYVAILHDGDLYRADLFEKAAGVLDRHPGAGFVFNAYEIVDSKGGRRIDRLDMPECMDGREFLRRYYISQWGCPIYGTAVIRRSSLEAVGPFDPRYSMHSDIEMWVRLASRFDVAYVPEPLMTLMPRESGHLLDRHFWWERTVDVRAKREASRIVDTRVPLRRLAFELRARLHYATSMLVPLKHGRWSEVLTGLALVATGRDELPPPY